MINKRKAVLAVFFMVALALIMSTVIMVIVATGSSTGDQTHIGLPVNKISTVRNDNEHAGVYGLSIVDGFVSVYFEGDIIYISNIAADSLRTSDRQMLSEGITVGTHEEVLQMLEDFGS